MANLPEQNKWEDGIYQLELTDRVIGGVDGTSNIQAKQLANRTNYLKEVVDQHSDILGNRNRIIITNQEELEDWIKNKNTGDESVLIYGGEYELSTDTVPLRDTIIGIENYEYVILAPYELICEGKVKITLDYSKPTEPGVGMHNIIFMLGLKYMESKEISGLIFPVTEAQASSFIFFKNCHNLKNIKFTNNMSQISIESLIFFEDCEYINKADVFFPGKNGILIGFQNCKYIDKCKLDISVAEGGVIAVSNSKYITQLKADLNNDNNNSYGTICGMKKCGMILECEMKDKKAGTSSQHNYGYAFENCYGVSKCSTYFYESSFSTPSPNPSDTTGLSNTAEGGWNYEKIDRVS